MELSISHIVIAVIAFILGMSVRRKPASYTPNLVEPAPGDLTERDLPQSRPPLATRVFSIVFLIAWLAGWTLGLFVVTGMFLATLGEELFTSLFLGAWIVGAAVAWILSVRQLVQMLTGQPGAFTRR